MICLRAACAAEMLDRACSGAQTRRSGRSFVTCASAAAAARCVHDRPNARAYGGDLGASLLFETGS